MEFIPFQSVLSESKGIKFLNGEDYPCIVTEKIHGGKFFNLLVKRT